MLKNNRMCLKAIVGILTASILVTPMAALAQNNNNDATSKTIQETVAVNVNGGTYSDYIDKHSSMSYSSKKITVNTDNLTYTENLESASVDSSSKAITINSQNKYAQYTFNVEESGLFNICLNYKPIADSSLDIRLSFEIDGSLPYEELGDVYFSRVWENKHSEIKKNDFGDELRPEQVEKYAFYSQWVKNPLGIYPLPYAVYLEAGTHTLKIARVSESICISNIEFAQYNANTPDYATYINSKSNVNNSVKNYTIEAESAFEKSSSTLSATFNNTNAGMSPANSQHQVINSFGGNCWNSNGQWASWIVPENIQEGMYVLRFRAKQDTNVGTAVFRRLYINGEIPFKEAEAIRFEYKNGWQIATFGADKPYLIHIKEGDEITLEATTGPLAEPLNKIYTSVNMLNDIYQSIIIVTSPDPDPERDYNIKREIPTLLDDIKKASQLITTIKNDISFIMGEKNSKVFFINKFIALLDGYVENYRTIVPDLDNFKSHIESYAGQTYDFNSLPLELDTIMLMAPESEIPKANVSFFKSFSFEIQRFFVSFAEDYNKIKSNKKDTLVVWTSLGRDQAQSVRQIILNDFAQNSNINVDLKITTTGLPNAILSGLEPDISLSATSTDVVDLAMRGQLLDIKDYVSKLPEEYMAQFEDSVWTPFKYKDGLYAMPTSQTFQMLFYRTDVFEKLGLKVPQTWDEFYKVLKELQKNNFQVGIQESNSVTPGVSSGIIFYETLLMQNGEEYFKNDLTEVNFESKGGKKAFLDWVRLYRDFDLDADFDLNSRFRSGEMPLVLNDYSFYQTISTIAPEISSRWDMAMVPATVDKDGNLNRTVSTIVTGSIILKAAQRRGRADAAFEFLAWWAGADAQVKYANALQSLQGIAGRPLVANKEAFKKLGWSDTEKELITTQRSCTKAIPMVPGNYIIARSLSNALRTSYAGGVDPLRQLSIKSRTINIELERKRAEFEKNN